MENLKTLLRLYYQKLKDLCLNNANRIHFWLFIVALASILGDGISTYIALAYFPRELVESNKLLACMIGVEGLIPALARFSGLWIGVVILIYYTRLTRVSSILLLLVLTLPRIGAIVLNTANIVLAATT